METVKFTFSAEESHYVYKDTRPIEYVNVFKGDKNGCFRKYEAIKFIRDCTKESKIKNPIKFIL